MNPTQLADEADRLAQLVSNLLDLSRQEAGLLLLNRVPTKVQALVAKIIEQQSQQLNGGYSRIPSPTSTAFKPKLRGLP